ncbi:MAG: TolC family protein [Phycisphaerales bacterium]|nr:TolC family protein [Phycisphaerales bacterium]
METHPRNRLVLAQSLIFTQIGAILAICGGCQSPIERQSERELQQSMIRAIETEIEQAKLNQEPLHLEQTLNLEKLEIREDHLEQIESQYSPNGYLTQLMEQAPDGDDPISSLVGENLMGQPTQLIGLTLENSIQTAVRNNLAVEVASFTPAISQSALTQAEAQFDWLFFANAQYQDSIIPQAGSGFGGSTSFIRNSSQSANASVGVSRQTSTGATIGISNDVNYTNVDSSFFGTAPIPNPANASNVTLDITQPLLQGFGRDTNMSQIHLARNAERSSVVSLKSSLIDAASDTEKAYWTLVLRYKELVIRSKLLERGIKVRDDIKARRVQDARQAQIADAVARVERRRSDLLVARTNLRNASDHLKQLMNDPSLPVGSETLIVPREDASSASISYSLLDSITTGITNRPEMEIALLTIDDATIRQQVAKNQRLPKLDLQAQARLLGFGDSFSDSYNDVDANRFVDDWLLGINFEQPVGNRANEAGYRKARLERMQSVVAYRQTAQSVVFEIKNALNSVVTNNALIAQSTLSRVAQGEALRSLIVEKELTTLGYSVERLNLELNQQESLANSEILEATSLINYNIAIVDLYKAMGTTLDQSRIDFVVPDSNQLAPGESALEYVAESGDAESDESADKEQENQDD